MDNNEPSYLPHVLNISFWTATVSVILSVPLVLTTIWGWTSLATDELISKALMTTLTLFVASVTVLAVIQVVRKRPKPRG